MAPNLTRRIREYASTFVILILLAGVLGFYYFKYIPERRTDFNRNAFLELSQIQSAFQIQNQAYRSAIQNILRQNNPDSSALFKFNYDSAAHATFDDDDILAPTRFELNDLTRRWQMQYPVFDHDTLVYPLYKDLDSLMCGIVSTYKDIFDGYLLISEEQSSGEINRSDNKLVVVSNKKKAIAPVRPAEKVGRQKDKVIYQSGDLTMDYLVNPDSLPKNNDGFSLLNIHDISIAGNPYKLFLYPFELGTQRLILAGLISDANYREANRKIPFSFFSLFIVLFLLLVIHLPILRIYILGPGERIRDTDIRLIIGSYFIAAFFGFFIFATIFLDKEQSVQNKNHLENLSDTIIHNFQTELGAIDMQLGILDSTLNSLCQKNVTDHLKQDTARKKNTKNLKLATEILKKDTARLHAMVQRTRDTAIIKYMDTLFKPRIYPYPDGVFWVGKKGKWVARWGFKYSLTRSPLIDVKDRSYFTDFKNKEALVIQGIPDSVAIQPTLSKFEGEYLITVTRRSKVAPYSEKISSDSTLHIKPFLIGLSSKMHSVTNVLLPTGYGFSIIDENGNVLYDSKDGRPLLSNILKQTQDPGGIRQTALYRNKRFFENLVLRGKNMALLSTPVKGMPYQLLVYYNRARSDSFGEHLIALSAGLIGMVICLLIFSSLINQWSKTKARMLESRSHHFEWLHPSADPLKEKYYLHLIRWMLILLGIYLLAWLVMETLTPASEFSMLFISLLFPFFIALHYYELRERYYDVQEHRTGINWYFSRPSPLLRGLLLIIIILINCFTAIDNFSWTMAGPVLATQLVWAALIFRSAYLFRRYMMGSKFTVPVSLPFYYKQEIRNSKYKIPIAFIWAIITGVILISIIPASGIFWLFFHQEKDLYLYSDQLTMAMQIDQRRLEINQNLKPYKLRPTNPTDRDEIKKLKFSHGIYLLSGRSSADGSGTRYTPLPSPSKEYTHLHRRIFPDDSLVLGWTGAADSADDGAWYFAKDSSAKDSSTNESGPELVYRNRKDENNPNDFRLSTNASASWNTAGLVAHSFSGTGTAFSIFFIVGLCFSLTVAYFLTLSLTKRIFLMELQQVYGLTSNSTSLAVKYYRKSGIQPDIQLFIFKTYRELGIDTPPAQNTSSSIDPRFPDFKDIYFFEKQLPLRMLEARMPWMISTMEPVYSALWTSLPPIQKFILYDFAQDGFANYKAGRDLQELMAKGLLFFDDLGLSVMTLSFQEYVLKMKEDPDINTFLTKTAKEDTWKKFKTPLLVLLTAIGIFIFATQEQTYQKITGLLTTLTSLLPLLSNMFNKPAVKGGE
jgi:hypothetical protein